MGKRNTLPESGTRKVEYRVVDWRGQSFGQFAFRATAQRLFETLSLAGKHGIAVLEVTVAW